MESCHSVLPPIIRKVPHPPTSCRRLSPKVYSTLEQLAEILEQLHPKEDLSVVVRGLVTDVGDTQSPPQGRSSTGQSPAKGADFVDLDPGTIIKISQKLRKLNADSASIMQTSSEIHGTNFASSVGLESVSDETPGTTKVGGGERVQKAAATPGQHLSLSKQDSLYLMKKIRDFEQKCKPLQEKNKKFLERNMELTTDNRSLKEQIRNIADENRRIKEAFEQCKRKYSVVSRQLKQANLEKGCLEAHAQEVEKLRDQISQHDNTIATMKQTAAEKDRRMEVLQHRKKRRLRMSAEYIARLSSPCSGADDEPSQDSDLSFSSTSGISDDDILDDLAHDDVEKVERVEKNYRRLQKEHLSLQKSLAKLQGILGWGKDEQRYIKSKLDFETDLYVSHCKIEQLEECLERYKDNDSSWVAEKETMISEIKSQCRAIHDLKNKLRDTTQAYDELKEQSEHLEFLVLETQEYNKDDIETQDAGTCTEDVLWTNQQQTQLSYKVLELDECEANTEVIEDVCIKECVQQLDMAESEQDVYRASIRGLEEQLTSLLHAQNSDVTTIMLQLKHTDQQSIEVIEIDNSLEDLQNRVISLQKENSGLLQKLARCKERLDSQEQSLSLTKDEREELMQVKHKTGGEHQLNNRLRLAEMGQTGVRERSTERESSWERSYGPLMSPRPPLGYSQNQTSSSAAPLSTSNPAPVSKSGENELTEARDLMQSERHFDNKRDGNHYENNDYCDNQPFRRFRINSLPTIGNDQSAHMFSEVDKLQRQIQELQDENDVLKFEMTQKGDGSDGSGSDSEDSRIVELRETCENLRERLQSAETMERQCKDRLKLAEKHIMELELAETVLRDRVEEGNVDCDKLRKQIVRLQRKIRELKDVTSDREASEQSLIDKMKYLEDAEALLSKKVTELEGTNHILKQRLDVKEEILANMDLVEGLQTSVDELKVENTSLQSKVFDLEENNELLRENWRKVADEDANRRECLEEKIRILEGANNDLKTKLKDHETDLDLSSGPSIASEINEDTIEQLNERIRELEKLLEENHPRNRLGSVESIEGGLNDTIIEMEKTYEKKLALLKREIAEYQQQEDDLCTRIEEMEENYHVLSDKLEKCNETEMNYKNKIEELENRETSLTIRFSQRVEEMEQNEKQISEKLNMKIEELEQKESELSNKVSSLEVEKSELVEKVNILEKHEKEASEKSESEPLPDIQENISRLQSHVSTAAGTSVVLHDRFESAAKLESEASVSVNCVLQNSTDITTLQSDNQKLLEQVSTLNASVEQYEKEQKSMEEKLKRQEKKRKRSERADNTDDYDTIAREVVTYKMEVDQLRAENNDLHERIMELDESEKLVAEKNDQLKNDMESLEKARADIELSNEREQKLVNRINELEASEQSLQDEVDQLKNSALSQDTERVDADSRLDVPVDSLKEMVDKSVGTVDFMEGVMPEHEQGKPVSSMFERIQILETDNQDLSLKLSTLTATDVQVRQLSEKVRGLEENEDSLMERVMELEDEEDRLRRELNKVRNTATSVSDIEDELTELKEKEDTLNSTIEGLKTQNMSLQKTMESSDSEKGGIAVRLASVQKSYENEKKKVESLLKGEEKWMKTVASEKRITKEMEEELSATQEKLEELQTEYESKLAERDDGEKVLKEEINKLCREKEMFKKKLNEFEKSNSELEDEIEHCKISESRMFHRLQQLNNQNEELELKLSKLAKMIPSTGTDTVDGSGKKEKSSSHLMSENPEVIPENPLTSSIFTETELDLLRSKTPDYDLLGSVPLDMLRKIKDFDQREQNYQAKIQEIETRNSKLVRNMKVLQSKEKDLKHEIKELQLVLLKHQASTAKFRASTSSIELDRSGSEEGMDSDNQSSDGVDDVEIFKADKPESEDNDYDSMTQEELLLSVKLLNEKQNQDGRRMETLEDQMTSVRELLGQVRDIVASDSMDTYLHSIEHIKQLMIKQEHSAGMQQSVVSVLEGVTSVKQRLEALQTSEANLRVSLAQNEIATDKLKQESEARLEQLQAQIHVLAKLSHQYQSDAVQQQQADVNNQSSSRRHLETSKTINIDVPPSRPTQGSTSSLHSTSLHNLGQSETIRVNVPPTVESEEECSDTGYGGYSDSASVMMDKAEDVLRMRIRELEKLEIHLKQQVTDLEADREELHEIARKDKAIIHEQNVLMRELQLSERSLQEQMRNFEVTENTLYTRLDSLEAQMDDKDDKIKHLEILEARLKDLVKQYKLDEKILVTKSETLETSMKQMSEKEENLRQKVQNLESEKCAFSERSEYLQLRLKEIENAETDLAQRAQNQENIMQTLQNTVIELETFGANAHARVVELEHVNFDLQQRLHHSMTENSPMLKQSTAVQQKCDEMEHELNALHDSEIQLRQENEMFQKNEMSLQQDVKVLRINKVELEGRVRDLEEGETIVKDKLSKLQRSENTLKYRVQELETSGIQAPSDLSTSQTGNMKLPRTLEDCQRRIIVLQANNAELQSRLQNGLDISGTSPSATLQGTKGTVSVPEAEYRSLERKVKVTQQIENQLEESDRLNTHLLETVAQLREGKDVCGHEVEIEVLRKRLDEANASVKILQNQPTGQWTLQGPNVTVPDRESRPSPGRDFMKEIEDGITEETMAKTSVGTVQAARPPGQKLSRDTMIDDLMKSLHKSPTEQVAEDKHWQEIESRMEARNNNRGGENWISVAKATSLYAENSHPHRSHGKDEELELGVALQSETDIQNDTDSGRYGNKTSPRLQQQRHNELYGSNRNSMAPALPQSGPPSRGEHLKLTADGFGDSLNVQDSFDELSDQNKEVMYRKSHPVGGSSMLQQSSSLLAPSIADSVADSGRATASVSMATSGMTLRERLAYIEKQLSARESDSAREFNRDLDLTSWNARIQESNRKLELAEKDNKQLKDEINKLEKDLEEKTRLYLHLDAFFKSTQAILADKNTIPDKEVVNRVEAEITKVVSNVANATSRPDDISHDPAALSNQLNKKDRELKAKSNEVDSLMQELRQWQTECRTIEDMRANALDSIRGLEVEVAELQMADKQLKDLKDDYNTLRGQAGDGGGMSPEHSQTYRTRILQLTNLCKEKDLLIKKLVQELKKFKSGAKASSLVDEICRLDSKSDHNHNQVNPLGRSSSQSSIDSCDRMSIVSDTELLRDSSHILSHRPHSADIHHHHRNMPHRASYHGSSNLPRHQRSSSHSHNSSQVHRVPARHSLRSHNRAYGSHSKSTDWAVAGNRNSLTDNVYRTTQYVAIADYDPSMFSQSGHPRLELALKEGDIVLVTGPINDAGYVEGEVKGRVGLVPLNYLQPSSPRRGSGNRRLVPEHLNASPERIAQLYTSLHNVHSPNTHAFHNGIPSGSTELPGNTRYVATVTLSPPDAPDQFHVEKIIGSSSLMLAWQPVQLDNNGCNNGVKVTGYKVYKNNKLLIQPRGRHAAKAVIENLNIQAHHRFGIQTVAADGMVSELSEIMYEGVEEVTSEENSDTESEMDMATVLNVDEYKNGHKRTFMGVYDYDPGKNSPYEHPSCELAFSAGDIITVYGRQRGDGFYYAELNGVRGLVPTFFIEEMPQPPPRTKKMAARNKQTNKDKNTTEKQDR